MVVGVSKVNTHDRPLEVLCSFLSSDQSLAKQYRK